MKLAMGLMGDAASASSTPLLTQRARRRLVDDHLAKALLALLAIYTIVTFLTYHKLAQSDVMVATEALATSVAMGRVDARLEQAHDAVYGLQHDSFPLHISDDDREEIPHPGWSILEPGMQEKWPKDLARTLKVPKFFDTAFGHVYRPKHDAEVLGTREEKERPRSSSVSSYSVRDFLGKHGKELITVEQAMSIGSFTEVGGAERETIYCSIASYRDPECTLTLEDLYATAQYPERIRVAIIDQLVEGDSKCATPVKPCADDPNQALCKYRHLIDVFEVDARMAVGPVFGRHLAHRHYRGEYFAMQIDSHVRFTKHWDEDIVGQWKSANNEMTVLTTYLSDLSGSIDPVTHESLHKSRPIMCESDYEGAGDYKHLRHGQQPEGVPFIRGEPTIQPFWAAGFSFARGHFVIQVPYDQYLPMVFQGEEISIGLRGFTYGYDYYAPERGICFHMYAIKENKDKRKKVPLFWENSKIYRGVGTRAMKRLNNIIGMAKVPSDDWQHDEQNRYGLGRVRDPKKFFKTFGIHTESQTVEHHLCRFVGQPMMKVFKPAVRSNKMGVDYDRIFYVFKDPQPKKGKKNDDDSEE